MALSGLKSIKQTPQPEDEGSCSDDGENTEGNAGWADSIAKVLNTTKPKTKKTLVLSRAKKSKLGENAKSATKTDFGFEVEGCEVNDEKPVKRELDEKSKQRKNVQLALRVKPSWKDIERERSLRKVATRGVVQLFNAVRIQQKDLQSQLDVAGPLDSRKEAILNNINKRKFLDVLMSGKRAKSEAVDNPLKYEHKDEDESSDEEANSARSKKSEWNVLREDYMTNKKIKHWDQDESDKNSQPDDSDDDEE